MKRNFKKRTFYFVIEQYIFNIIETELELNNKVHKKGKLKLKLDVAVFLVHTISRLSIIRKDCLVEGYVRLKAEYFKKIHPNYKTHIDFLVKHKILKKIPYSIEKNQSFGYKIIHDNSIAKTNKFVLYEALSFTFRRKIKSLENGYGAQNIETVKHLTKWIYGNQIKLVYEEALDYIYNSNMKNTKKISRRYSIENIQNQILYCTREGKDNRLHSNLTALPSDMRKFVRYKDENLISLDLKSSQPYLLAGLLNLIVLKDYDRIDFLLESCERKLRDKMKCVLSIMIPTIQQSTNIKGIREFIKTVSEQDIYTYISDNLCKYFLIEKRSFDGGFNDMFFSKSLGKKRMVRFESLRDYCKRIFLEYLYCSPKSSEKRYKEVRRVLPNTLNEFIDEMKRSNKNDFPIFLQNIEANLFLDIITKEISQDRPSMFLATIHDSIIVPDGNQDYVEEKMIEILTDRLLLKPEIKNECWCDNEYRKVS